MIISLGTRKQTGKDTVAKYLIEKYGFTKAAFADPLKEELRIMLLSVGFEYDPSDESSKELYRPMLIAYGTHFRRVLEPDCWVDKVQSLLLQYPHQDWVISDMRYPNEAKMLKSLGAQLIKISRQTTLTIEPTENMGDSIPFDHIVDNDSTIEELYDQIDAILTKLK